MRQKDHEAMFPIELPARLIRMYTFWGERVLDPFVGSGTTLKAADKYGRVGVGIDVRPSMEALCRGWIDLKVTNGVDIPD